MNCINVTGRLVKDPELRFTHTEKAVCEFSVACDRRFKSPSGEKEADFFQVTAWGKTAEFVANYLAKGRLVAITGRMEQQKWVDKESGQNRSKFVLVADTVDGLDRAPEQAEDGQPEPEAEMAPAPKQAPKTAPAVARKAVPVPVPQAANEDEEGYYDPFASGE